MKKVIAFYLPQYHCIPENDKWWGEGFTEWTNVKNAKPLFEGHKQPKRPLNDNYYNLLDDKVKQWQIDIAKENGIYGFCFYHYWFSGKLMLEKPVEQFLNNKSLDFNFCLCWANPPWTKVWAGKGSEILIDQEYGNKEDWKKHVDYLIPFFSDPRYIKESGEPLFVIYSPAEIRCLPEMLTYLRERAREAGFPGIKILYQYYVDEKTEKKLLPLFDYSIRFQPIYALNNIESRGTRGKWLDLIKKTERALTRLFKISLGDKLLRLRTSDYDEVWEAILNEQYKNEKIIPCAFVSWDNTPRRGKAGRVIVNSSPEKFKDYFKKLIIKSNNECSNDYLFVTAWNEWSEGSYLEPDENYGDSYLKAIKCALSETNNLK